jgi:hypothetical protein
VKTVLAVASLPVTLRKSAFLAKFRWVTVSIERAEMQGPDDNLDLFVI